MSNASWLQFPNPKSTRRAPRPHPTNAGIPDGPPARPATGSQILRHRLRPASSQTIDALSSKTAALYSSFASNDCFPDAVCTPSPLMMEGSTMRRQERTIQRRQQRRRDRANDVQSHGLCSDQLKQLQHTSPLELRAVSALSEPEPEFVQSMSRPGTAATVAFSEVGRFTATITSVGSAAPIPLEAGDECAASDVYSVPVLRVETPLPSHPLKGATSTSKRLPRTLSRPATAQSGVPSNQTPETRNVEPLSLNATRTFSAATISGVTSDAIGAHDRSTSPTATVVTATRPPRGRHTTVQIARSRPTPSHSRPESATAQASSDDREAERAPSAAEHETSDVRETLHLLSRAASPLLLRDPTRLAKAYGTVVATDQTLSHMFRGSRCRPASAPPASINAVLGSDDSSRPLRSFVA